MKARRRAFAVLWTGQFAATAGLTVVVPFMPLYLGGLGVAPSDVLWWTAVSIAAPAITHLVSAPLWGLVGDRHGPKAMVVRAHAGLGLAVALMALARTPEVFLLCRLLQGACGGVVGATSTYASSLAAAHRRGRAFGGLFGATAAGALVGPLVGGLLAGELGFGVVFAGVAALLMVSGVVALAVLPEPARGERSHDAFGRSLAQVGATLLQVAHGRNLVLAGLAAQAAVFALVVVFATQVERITGSIGAAIVWVGVLQAVTWAASLAGGPWWGRRNDRRPAQRAFALAAACCGLVVALQAVPASPETLLPLRIAQGFCFAALAQSVLYVVAGLLAEPLRGTGLGLATGVLDLGQVVGPLFGAAAAALLPVPATFAAIGALLGGAALLALRSERQSAAETLPMARQPSPGLVCR